MSGLAYKSIIDQLTSKCSATGLFASVNGHEPKNAPEKGLTAAVWVDRLIPYPSGSGLTATSVVVTVMVRLYTPMITDPADMIDPTLVAAADTLMGSVSGDFDLGSTVRNVDLLGETGQTLSAQAGYVDVSGTMFRIIDITVPCITDAAWAQG
jgi:hypothetical protein